jgi:hypothetical protein
MAQSLFQIHRLQRAIQCGPRLTQPQQGNGEADWATVKLGSSSIARRKALRPRPTGRCYAGAGLTDGVGISGLRQGDALQA